MGTNEGSKKQEKLEKKIKKKLKKDKVKLKKIEKEIKKKQKKISQAEKELKRKQKDLEVLVEKKNTVLLNQRSKDDSVTTSKPLASEPKPATETASKPVAGSRPRRGKQVKEAPAENVTPA